MNDLTYLKLERLIIHELPRRELETKNLTAGILSDTVSPLTGPVRHFFEERIRVSLSTSGFAIQPLEKHASTVPAAVRDATRGKSLAPKKFVRLSHAIANRLFKLQNNVHSEGLVGIASCSLDEARGISIIKLELEEGVRARLMGAQGAQHFEIEKLDDLMLTRNTRVFKVALFLQRPGQTLEGLASDNQRPRGELLADYFLNHFLGCSLVHRPDTTTRDFLDTAEAYINDLSSPILRSRYHTALMAELASSDNSIDRNAFANTHFDKAERAGLLKAFDVAQLPPRFPKDVGLVKPRIVRMRFDFARGVSVSLPPEQLNQTVALMDGLGGKTRVEVEDHLEKILGAK